MPDRHVHLIREDLADEGPGELRRVDLLVLRHQGEAGQRVVVLPAGERADAAHRRLDHREPGPVALPPDHALVIGRRDLPALQLQRTVRVEDQLRVIERAVIALVDPEHDHHPVPARCCRDGVRHRPRHAHRMLVEAQMLRPLQCRRHDEREIRVVGHERLGEDREARALPRRLLDGVEHPLQRPIRPLQIGGDLDGGRPDHPVLGHRALRPRPHTVQVSMITALSRLCSRMQSSTSSGLIMRIPSMNEGSPWP